MADENKTPKMARPGLGALNAAKKKKKKKLLNANEFFELVDSKKQFSGPKSTKGSLGNSVNRFRDLQDNIVVKMKKGGRAGYSVGGKAIKGVSKILLKK